MKLSTIGIASLASSVLAAPAPRPQFSIAGLMDPLIGGLIEGSLSIQMGKTRPKGPDDFNVPKGPCNVDNILVVARGTSDSGNVGTFIGGPVCVSLNNKLGAKFSCQGIGAPGYPAYFMDNLYGAGTCASCIETATKTFEAVSAQCPAAKMAFLGYSQGAAIMHQVVPKLSPKIKSQLVAGVLFGDTKNSQTKGTITGFPQNKLKSWCSKDDGVCGGYLNVNAGHVSYRDNNDTERAADWLYAKFTGA